jgi:hypothetical protein
MGLYIGIPYACQIFDRARPIEAASKEHEEATVNSTRIEKTRETRAIAEEAHERRELAGRDNYVYTFDEGKVVRVGRKDWAALYAHGTH